MATGESVEFGVRLVRLVENAGGAIHNGAVQLANLDRVRSPKHGFYHGRVGRIRSLGHQHHNAELRCRSNVERDVLSP